MEEINWGGSGIEKVVFDWIKSNIKEGSTIIELGAGHVSTKALCKDYKLYSIEHNKEYTNLYDSNYIFAPTVGDWYDLDIVKAALPTKKEQALIIIDGSNRSGLIKNIGLFRKGAKFLIHDTYREDEIALANKLGKVLKRKPKFYTDGDYWAVI